MRSEKPRESRTSIGELIRKLIPRDRIIAGPFEIATLACPIEHTLTIQGGARVQNPNPAQLTSDEWDRLLDNWNARAEETMQLYCDRVGGEDCRKVVPLLVTYPPQFRVRIGANGQPPHLLFIEMDIKFRCEAGPV